MKEEFCNECGDIIDKESGVGWCSTEKWGEFCGLKCMDTFMGALRDAGVRVDLWEGEEPDVVY